MKILCLLYSYQICFVYFYLRKRQFLIIEKKAYPFGYALNSTCARRFELPTFWSVARRSIQLSYAHIFILLFPKFCTSATKLSIAQCIPSVNNFFQTFFIIFYPEDFFLLLLRQKTQLWYNQYMFVNILGNEDFFMTMTKKSCCNQWSVRSWTMLPDCRHLCIICDGHSDLSAPDSILSSQTEYPSYYCYDFTDKMDYFRQDGRNSALAFLESTPVTLPVYLRLKRFFIFWIRSRHQILFFWLIL